MSIPDSPHPAADEPVAPDSGHHVQVVPEPPRQPWASLLAALGVVVAVSMSGLLLAWAWYVLAPTLPLKKVDAGAVYLEEHPEQLVAADGWFSILGLAFGLLAAVLVWLLLRNHRGPLQLFALLVGSVVAGWLGWWLGHRIGLSAYQDQLAHAPVDTILHKPIDLRAKDFEACIPRSSVCAPFIQGGILVPALGAVISYAMLAAWSRWSSLRPEPYDDELAGHDDAISHDDAVGHDGPARDDRAGRDEDRRS